MSPRVRGLAADGFNVHIHAIGDRAIRQTLDAIEAARPEAGDRDLRFQMAQMIGLPEALAAYTIGAAYAMGLEKETGSIEVGNAPTSWCSKRTCSRCRLAAWGRRAC